MNIPEVMPVFRVRQYFEVCGILSDIYIARQLNLCGQVYGFVRFEYVKNRDKLEQALNNIWIDDFRVWAREARFDRFAKHDEEVRDYRRGEGKVEMTRPVVLTHAIGIKNVRVDKKEVEERVVEEEKIMKGANCFCEKRGESEKSY